MKKFHAPSNERGVALIFALGLLTLLSVLGVAFVTNSLTAQKIAANVGARNEAQQLMDSAVNRIMISLMAVLRQDKNATDYSVIYSSNDGSQRDAGTETDKAKDQLDDAEKSKLNVFVVGQPKYDGSKSPSTWLYIRDNGGNIVGRMAYQVLPTGTSSMSLDQVLKGIYNPERAGLPSPGKGDDANQRAWSQRIGSDIREFNVGRAAAFHNEWMFGTSGGYAKLPADDGDVLVSSFDNFFSSDMFKDIIASNDTTEDAKRQVWLRRWFSESTNTSPEAFYRTSDETTKMEDATPYHRFNLGPLPTAPAPKDAWYSRFKGFDVPTAGDESMKNSEKVLNELFKDSQVFYAEDEATPPGVGVPYLTRICADKGSFDSIENRRRQIAANLNDYCDSDNIPTSDVPAADWSIDKMPAWTGNEKTPYINEFVVGMKLTCEKSALGNVKIKMTPQLLTELISIYKDPAAVASYQSWLSRISVRGKVSVEGSATYVYRVGSTTIGPRTKSLNFSRDFSADFPGSGSWIFPDPQSLSLSWNAGYAVVKQEASAALEVPVDLEEKIRNGLAEEGFLSCTVQSVTYTTAKVEISEISCDLRGAVLRDEAGNGVDFVRAPGTITKTDSLPLDLDPATLTFADSNAAKERFAYLSGMEARDPRQNLYFTRASAPADFKSDASDWKCLPALQAKSAETVAENIGSINIDASGTPSGTANSCSNPSAPFSAGDKFSASADAGEGGSDYDKETVADPAWRGNEAGQHMSTAYIRNAPMQSLWELGAIHRGSAWETINIKRAVMGSGSSRRRVELSDSKTGDLAAAGVPYVNGDGLILDQVKLTSKAYTSGKLDVNMLLATPSDPGYDTAWDKDIARALFAGIVKGHQIGDLYASPFLLPVSGAGLSSIGWGSVSDEHVGRIRTAPEGRTKGNTGKFVSRADFVEGYTDPGSGSEGDYFPANGFGLVSGWIDKADAQQEELVGKTVNLLTAGATTPTTIQAVVVVQTIKSAPNNVTIVKPTYAGTGLITPTPSLTTSPDFDMMRQNGVNIYFDEITGELRALVTIKRITGTGGALRFRLYNVRYF